MTKAFPLLVLVASAAAAPAVTQVNAIFTTVPLGTQPGAAPPLVTSATTDITTHGPWSGTPTTVGQEQAPATLSATLPVKPNPTATYYNTNGKLTQPELVPFMPGGWSSYVDIFNDLTTNAN
jgi:hypothetical protein